MIPFIPQALYSMAGGGFVDTAFQNARTTGGGNGAGGLAVLPNLHEMQSNACALGFDTLLGFAMLGGNAAANADAGNSKTNIGLVGKAHYLGANLEKPAMMGDGTLRRTNAPGAGRLIGTAPILIEYNREMTRFDFAGRLLHVYTVVEKQARIINGKFVSSD